MQTTCSSLQTDNHTNTPLLNFYRLDVPDAQPTVSKHWKGKKGCPCSITEHRIPELISVLGRQPAGDVSHKPGSRLPLYFPPGLQLPSQPLCGLLPILLLGEQRHDGCECLRLLPDSIAAVIWTEAFCAWVQHANHSAAKALKASIILHRKVRKLHESTDLDWTRNFPRLFLRQFAACTTAAGHVAA